jgi:hypothetical protein
MEVVLLWLDDLDDLVFSAALAFERLRTLLLQVGLVASYGIVGAEVSIVATRLAPMLAIVAAACVGTWLFGATSHVLYHRRSRAAVTAA